MKKIILFLLLSIFGFGLGFSQDKGITYQAVIYQPGGEELPGQNNSISPLVNSSICLKFSFKDYLQNTEYQEIIRTRTDDFGLINLVIGINEQTAGYANGFNDIIWNRTEKNLTIELDTTDACTDFEEISNEVFNYVPFAFSAVNTQNVLGIVSIENGGTGASTIADAKINLELNNVENTNDLNKPISTATQSALNLKENGANKSMDLSTDGASDVKFPTVKSVKTYVDAEITTSNGASGTALATLQGAVDQNESDSDAAETALQTNINTLGATVASNATNIASNDTDIATNASGISTNVTNIAANTATGATNATNIASNDTDIATNASGISTNVTNIAYNTAKTGITSSQASAITANTAKVGYTDALVSTNTDVAANTAKTGLTPAQTTLLGNTSGTNTGDQDISEIATNATNISSNDTDIATNVTAIALNTVKISVPDDSSASSGQVLQTNGSGALSWATSSTPTFVYGTSNTLIDGTASVGSTLTTGNLNSAYGYLALSKITTGQMNTASGAYALYSNDAGSYNTASGETSMRNNTDGSFNTASGYAALYTNSSGNHNIAIGGASLFENTTGSKNSANGYQTLRFNNTGNENSTQGYQSLYYNTSGSKNVALGYRSGWTNTTGSNNTLIGSSADVTNDNLTNATAIGYNASVAASNTIQLGNTSITNVKTTGSYTGSGFKTPTGTSSQYLMADGSVSSGSSGSSGPQILTETQRNALNLTSSGTMIFNSTTNQYQASVYYTTGYNYNYFTTINYGFSEIIPGHSLTQTFTGKGQVITSANIAVVNMNRVSNTGDFTFEIWDETYQYPIFSTTITLSGAGTVSVPIPNDPWFNTPRTLPNGTCSFRITSNSGTGGSADFLMNGGASVGSLSNSYWSSLGGTPSGYTTPTTSHVLAIDLFPQNGLTWVSFN